MKRPILWSVLLFVALVVGCKNDEKPVSEVTPAVSTPTPVAELCREVAGGPAPVPVCYELTIDMARRTKVKRQVPCPAGDLSAIPFCTESLTR